jgi:radical SAM superfamily enzyme YgiQ (UPF0313 family)
MERKTQVLLINPPNPEPSPTYFGPPYGLSLIGARLLREGISVAGFDMDNYAPKQSWVELARRVKKLRPQLIGITCQSSTRGAVYRLLEMLRSSSCVSKLVVGGPFVNDFYSLLLKSGADCAVIGDGEVTMPELVRAYESGKKPWSVPGVAALCGGKLKLAPPRAPVANLDDNPFPAFELFDFKERLAPARFSSPGPLGFAPDKKLLPRCRVTAVSASLMLLSSSGCLYGCNFCPMSKNAGPKLRFHSPEYFVAMAEHFSRAYGIRDFVFGDNFFTADNARTFKICSLLEKLNPKIRWMCMTRCDAVTPQLLNAMRRAGCMEISYGVESCSKTVQRALGKGLDPDCVGPCIENTEAAGMDSVLMLMCGSPGESERTVRETLGAIRLMSPARAMVKRVNVYPGTRLHDMAAKAGIPPRGYYEGTQHKAPYYTAELPEEELARLHRMLRERRVYLDLPAAQMTPDLMKKYCLAACQRGETVVFGGAALDSPDIFAALDCSAQAVLHRADFRTDAQAILKPGFAKRLRSYPFAETLLVPFYSDRPEIHDAITASGGSLARSLAAAVLWRKSGGRSRVGIYLRDDMGDTGTALGWLASHGICGVDFVLGSGSDWPEHAAAGRAQWSMIRQRVAGMASSAAESGLEIGVCGLPECMLSGMRVDCENFRPLDERLTSRGPVALSRERELKFKTKPARCSSCAVNGQCEGIWKWYIKAYGDSEIRPL